MDMGYLVRRAAREWPSSVALQCRDEQLSFAALDDRAVRLARGLLGLGLRAGDRVGVLLSNRIEYPEVDIGLAYAGLVRVALNTRLMLEDHQYILADADVAALITEPEFDSVAEPLTSGDRHWIRLDTDVDLLPVRSYKRLLEQSGGGFPGVLPGGSAPAWISYTSGTTGRPKGVVLSHRAITQVAFNMLIGLRPLTSSSSVLLPQPLSHGAGYFVLPLLTVGGTVHVMPKWDADKAIDLGVKHSISMLKIVPTMLVDLISGGRPAPFESVVYGAASISQQHIEQACGMFGPTLTQIYGQSEMPATITLLDGDDHARPGPHLSSGGRPWRTVELKVVDDKGNEMPRGDIGEIIVRGPQMMDGYRNQPELTADVVRDGWVWTRDLGVQDEQGYVYLRGRRDEMINSGGYNIAPKEVEEVLAAHPAVAECVATGVEDDRFGQVVRLYVELRPGASATEEELREFGKERLGFRRPRSVVFVESLPRTAYGKVDRKQLVALGGAEA